MADPNEETIRSFYAFIEEHAFENAYALYSVPKISLSTFRGWYENVEEVQVTGIRKADDHVYDFAVSLTESDGIRSQFYVRMRVEHGKLETLSSDHVRQTTEVCHEDICADIYRNYDDYWIQLKYPNAPAPTMVDDTGNGAVFSHLRFSPGGHYIVYDETFDTPQGKNIVNALVHSVATNEHVNVVITNPNFIDVLRNDTRIVACGIPGDSEQGYVMIYSLQNQQSELLAWRQVSHGRPHCTYDPATEELLWTDGAGNRERINLITGAVQ